MRFAYADPPYPGCCRLYRHHHPDGRCWDDIETTRLLVARLQTEFPDGWALSTNASSLQAVLSVCPEKVRVLAWMKTCAPPKSVRVQYFWEPVILAGGRPYQKGDLLTVRDVLVCMPPPQGFVPTSKTHVIGEKPKRFARWIFDCLGAGPGDELVDVFPGSGAIGREWDAHERQGRLVA